MSFLPESGKVADSRHCRLTKDQPLLNLGGENPHIKANSDLFMISFCITCKYVLSIIFDNY